MTIKISTSLKLGVIACISIGLTACGSSGGGSGTKVNLELPKQESPINTEPSINQVDPSYKERVKSIKNVSDEPALENLRNNWKREYTSEQLKNLKYFQNEKQIQEGESFPALSVGFHSYRERHEIDDKNYGEATVRIYELPYSQILAWSNSISVKNGQKNERKEMDLLFSDINGLATPPDTAKSLKGSATYTGQAFDSKNTGKLTYSIDFGKQTGEGKITGFKDYGDIKLEKSNLKGFTDPYNEPHLAEPTMAVDRATATFSKTGEKGSYSLGLFGPKAEEIVGVVYDKDNLPKSINDGTRGLIGFGGQRGELK